LRRRNWFWKGCKPNSVFPVPQCVTRERIICLCSQYPEPVPLARDLERATPRSPIWPCTRWGFPCPVACASSGGLLHHLFTLAGVSCETPAVSSLWHCPSGRLAPSPPACIPEGFGVTRHRALWCSDFPPSTCAESDPPPFQNRREYNGICRIKQACPLGRRSQQKAADTTVHLR